MMDKFNEFYMMQNQAKKFEQAGLDDKALELYLKIVNDYLPNNDFSYDRAATLLEKKFKYAEAIVICEKVMEKIKTGDVPGDADKFQLKIDRIRLKMKNEPSSQTTTEKKEPEVFHFGLPGFRTTNKLIMFLGTAYYALAAFAAYPDQLFTFLFLFSMAFAGSYGIEMMMKLANSKTCKKAFAVTLIALIIAGYSVAQIPQVKVYWSTTGSGQSEGLDEGDTDGENAGNGNPETPDTDRIPPEIPQKYLDATSKTADKHPASDLANVTVDQLQILITVVVKPGTSHENILELSDDMVRTLGGLMTSENLKGPTDETFGELYDFYGVSIQVVDTLEQPVSEGTLIKKTKKIIWSTP